MPFLIGTDEAGYGPNLGPLTITGTLWEVPTLDIDLYKTLDRVVINSASKSKLFVADSKKVYSPSSGIKTIETVVLSFLQATQPFGMGTWQQLIQNLSPSCQTESCIEPGNQPWLTNQSLSLPHAADVILVAENAALLEQELRRLDIRLVKTLCSTIFPREFNQGVSEFGNKATLLTNETLKIVAELMSFTDGEVFIQCDKHGGRSKYNAFIQQWLTEQLVTIDIESKDVSRYQFLQEGRAIKINFQAKGESFLPTALASMVSKYIREIFMELWNQFWQLKIPDLKPTKGYPQDAKRFKSEINQIQQELGIDDEIIWRTR